MEYEVRIFHTYNMRTKAKEGVLPDLQDREGETRKRYGSPVSQSGRVKTGRDVRSNSAG